MASLTQSFPLLTTASTAAPEAQATHIGCGAATATLTAGLAAHSEAAFLQFHSAYFDRLLRYHLVLARGDETVAREALQETLVRVARHARRFEQETAFWCWLTVLARSAAIDAGRKRHRYWDLLTRYARSLTASETPAPGEDADVLLQRLLDASLEEIPAEERALIERKYLHRESVRELAAGCGLTEKAVESRLLRARKILREKVLAKLRHEAAS